MPHNSNKLISLFISFCLILEQTAFAQSLDLSRYLAHSPAQAITQSDKFRPLRLRYISYDNQSNDFKLLLDKGDFLNGPLKGLSPLAPSKAEGPAQQLKGLSPQGTVPNEAEARLQEATQELMKFFFIGLALPNEKFWVNLRPDSPDNILDPLLEKTDIGRIFLEADVQLKKDTAAMTSPQTKEGKEYWDKLYKKAGELFGTEHIAIPTITRPWIVPNEIIIREAPDNAYIYKATLKVMLEEDYLKSPSHQVTKSPVNQAEYSFKDPRLKELNEYSTQLIKETIIPKLTYEVNTSKRYAPLRQVYYSLILAQWFKQKYKGLSPKGTVPNRIDSGDLTNLTSKEPYDKQSYFQQYQKSFKDGEYNLQEPVSTTMGQSIRRYVSGGMQIDCSSAIETGKITAGSSIKTSGNKAFYLSEANFSSSSMRPSRSSSAMENRDSQVPHHWDTQWKLPSQKAIDAADAFKEFFKNELLSDKKILDGDMSRIYELFIEDEAGNYIDNGGNYEIRPAAEVLKALYLRYPKLAAAIIGSIRTRNHHIFWCLALESLEVSLFQKLIDEAVSMNLKNEAISVGGVEYLPDYAGFDLAGALLLMIEDMFKERLSILSEAGQSFIIDYAFDFLAARWRGGGRLNEKNVLKVLNLLLVKNPGLYHRLSDRIVKLLKSPSQGNPLSTIAINPVSIEDVMSEDVFKEINSLKPFKIDAMPDYLSFLERLIQSAYDDIYNIEHMRNLTVAITKVRHYWKEGGYYDFALDQWRDTENIIISIKNDGDDKRRKAAVESKKVFLIEYFMKQLNKLWADFLFQRGIVVSPLAIGRTVGKLRVITDAVAKDPDFWLGLKEDEIVVVADFPPNVSLINPPRGVINTLASGITSHASVRAKKWGIPCAGLYGISMDMLANLNGQWAVLEALFPKGVLRRVSEAEIANYSRPARVFEKIKVGPANLSNESPDVITEYTQGIEQFLGFKAVNQLFLQDKEIGAKLPRSVGVTYKRFKDILALPENAKSKDEINALLKNIDRTNNTAIRESLGKIRGLILSLKVTKNIEGVVMSSIGKHIPDANKLMVRLATNADDLPDHPGVGAGTYGSYICEQREPQIVVNAILNAYASLFSYDAFIEREVYDIYHNEVFPSILIQEFVPADYSFGIHTVHPVSGDKNKMLIEIVQGLGPGLRDKLCPGLPYQSIYDKERKEIIEVVPATKTTKVVYLPDGLGGFPITAAADYVRDVFLGIQGPAIAKRIAEIGILIERLIREGQDIEGAIVMRNGRPELYIVQSRAQILSFASSAVEGFKTENNGTDAFVIGGKNSNESIDRLGKLNGIPIEEIEGNARSGRYSSAGFIGRNQSLKEVLKADNTFVSSKGFTHQELAAPLLQIIGLMDKKDNVNFTFMGKEYTATYISWRGFQVSIFNDEYTSSRDVTITRAEDGKKIRFSWMLPYYIKDYGFYEGETPYRLAPQDIIEIFELKPGSKAQISFVGPFSDKHDAVYRQSIDDKVSSPLGGITFSALPIQTQTMSGASSALTSGTVPLASARIALSGTVPVDLDAEWAQIQAVFNAGICPSIQRISEYTAAAAASPLADEKIDQVRGMLADILRSEEEDEKLPSIEPALKGLLGILEAV